MNVCDKYEAYNSKNENIATSIVKSNGFEINRSMNNYDENNVN